MNMHVSTADNIKFIVRCDIWLMGSGHVSFIRNAVICTSQVRVPALPPHPITIDGQEKNAQLLHHSASKTSNTVCNDPTKRTEIVMQTKYIR